MTIFATVDQLAAAAAHVERNWGTWGYRVAAETGGVWQSGVLFVLRSSDGGHRRFHVDRWGAVVDVPDGADRDAETAMAWVHRYRWLTAAGERGLDDGRAAARACTAVAVPDLPADWTDRVPGHLAGEVTDAYRAGYAAALAELV